MKQYLLAASIFLVILIGGWFCRFLYSIGAFSVVPAVGAFMGFYLYGVLDELDKIENKAINDDRTEK